MPYSREHKERTRERILTSALRLFSERGFAQVTIDDVMAHAHLTRGAFYAHFDSKEHLYAEAIDHGIVTSAITQIAGGPNSLKTLQRMVDNYLTHGHVNGTVAPCPLAFFSTDVGVREQRVRNTYTNAFRSLAGTIGRHTGRQATDERALAMTVLMVGGVAVCSALTDTPLKDQILTGCRRAIMDMVENNSTPASMPQPVRQAGRKSHARSRKRRARS